MLQLSTKNKATGERQPRQSDGVSVKDSLEVNPLWQSFALNTVGLQPKLAVSPPDDPDGRETAQHMPAIDSQRDPVAGAKRSASPLPYLNTIQGSFGHHAISHVNAHTDSSAAARAWALGAEAFTRGSDVAFARPPTLHTAAHEAAHVIQQRAGVAFSSDVAPAGDAYERHADEVADRVVRGLSSEDLLDAHVDKVPTHQRAEAPPVTQLRRIPPNVRALLTAVGSSGMGLNFYAHAEGVLRLIDLAMEELTAPERARVNTRRLAGLTAAQFNALPRLERRSRYAEAILAEFPTLLRLGDPRLLDIRPVPASVAASNTTIVVGHARAIFDDIATGVRDPWLTQVFGPSMTTAKANYALARTQMMTLHAANNIVTDRGSGFSDEVSEAGLSGPNMIRVGPSVIDDPHNVESRVTMLHESMHAGNPAISDDIYILTTGFETQDDSQKIVNAAHYEVVPWRILSPRDRRAYPATPVPPPPAAVTAFQPFVPAGTTRAGVTAAARTVSEDAAVEAYSLIQGAWALGLNLHRRYVQLFNTPTDWTTPQFGGTVHFNNSIPFWSKVQKLTIHLKAIINPASADEASRPVSQIDIALSEGMTRRLGEATDVFDPLTTNASILAFEAANSTAAERAAAFPGGAHTNLNTERDFLIKLAVRHPRVMFVTGNASRDLRVIKKMGDPALSLWPDILRPRNPDTFAD